MLAIDEFKDNATGEKYQCILTDPKNRMVLDILSTRFEGDLNSYFRKSENEQRQNVHFFVSDMRKPYSYNDGFTEGYNNKVKVLKRNAYGYRNFRRFRNRILHIFSHQKLSADS